MPETMAQTLARLQAANSDIGSAISAKGVTVPSGSGFEDYPSLISSIPSGSSAAKTVQFIDYDGTLLYEYTPSEFLALSSMPANYDHTSLGDGLGKGVWNHTYEGARYQVMTTGFALIGQVCELVVPQSAIDAFTAFVQQSIANQVNCAIRMFVNDVSDFGVKYTHTTQTKLFVDWGDGSTFDYKNYDSGSGTETITHTYSVQGDYVISVYTYNSGYTTLFQNNGYSPTDTASHAEKINKMYISFEDFGSGSQTSGMAFSNFINLEYLNIYRYQESTYADFPLPIFQTSSGSSYSSPDIKAFVIPRKLYYSKDSTVNKSLWCNRLGELSLSMMFSPTTSGVSITNPNCRMVGILPYSNIPNIIIPASVYSVKDSFNNCSSLKRVVFSSCGVGSSDYPYYNDSTATIDGSFKDCSSLEEIYFTRITPTSNKKFYNITNNSFQNLPTTCKIYVPRCRYDDYITSTAISGSGMPDPTVYEYIGY